MLVRLCLQGALESSDVARGLPEVLDGPLFRVSEGEGPAPAAVS